MSASFTIKQHFLSKKVPLLKAIVWELCYRVFSSVFSFCKAKGYYYWKHNVCSLCGQNQASGLLQIGTKSKNDNDLRIFRHDVNVKLFWPFFLSIFNFSYWFKFHVNIITSSGLMTIFFYKGYTRNPETGIPPPEFCSISGDWSELWILTSSQMSLMECYWMLRNSRFTTFTVLELLRVRVRLARHFHNSLTVYLFLEFEP